MTTSFHSITTAAATAVLLCLTVAALPARAQAHEETSGDYVLRASTVNAANLPETMRVQHGIGLDPHTAVLNVTVQRKGEGTLHNVPARMIVRSRNLQGEEAGVDMRETVANERVSYMGTYRSHPGEVLDFRITAHPEGVQQAITLSFRNRLGPR